MKLAYVCGDRGVPVFGVKGCSLHVQEVIRAFVSGGADVSLFAAATQGETVSGFSDVRVHRIRRERIEARAVREQADLSANDDIVSQLKSSGPFDMVYERYSLWSTAGMQYARQAGIPGVLEVNAPLIDEQARYRGLVNRADATHVARQCFRHASVILAVSDGVAEYLRNYPEARGKIHVLPNGVNTARFPAIERSTANANTAFTVGFIGTLKPWHGLHDLLDAYARIRREQDSVRMLVVGDGPERDGVIARVEREGWSDAVEMTGAVSPDAVPGLLARMDAGTAPYPDDPSFYFSPLKVYEYMAAGLPVVASRIGQIDGLVRDGDTGLLYKAGDTKGLARALLRLASDRGLGMRMGSAARTTAIHQHSWDSRVREIIDVAFRDNAAGHRRGVA